MLLVWNRKLPYEQPCLARKAGACAWLSQPRCHGQRGEAAQCQVQEPLSEKKIAQPSEIPCLKPARPCSLSKAVTEFLERMMLTMPSCTVTKILHSHPNSAFSPILYTYKQLLHLFLKGSTNWRQRYSWRIYAESKPGNAHGLAWRQPNHSMGSGWT